MEIEYVDSSMSYVCDLESISFAQDNSTDREITSLASNIFGNVVLTIRPPSSPTSSAPRNTTQNLPGVVTNAVTTCYNAYAPSYDSIVRRNLEYLSSGGASSAALLVPTESAKQFGSAIINQLSALASSLSHSEKTVFWNLAGQCVKERMAQFCSNYRTNANTDLNQHIDNLINMKITFG